MFSPGRRVWLSSVASVTVLSALAPLRALADAERMTYIEYRVVASGIAADSFDGAPRKLWRLGDRMLRFEEPRNPANGAETLLVANLPDAWLVDRGRGKGSHMTDPGPTYNVIFPVFQAGAPAALKSLQMGREKDFLEARGTQAGAGESIDGKACTVLTWELDDTRVKLWVDAESGLPRQISMRTSQVEYAIRYDVYRTDLAPDAALFKKPEGVEIEERR
jgi:hypothetical protein